MIDQKVLEKIAKLLRYYILISTSKAGSGHPTSSLSSVEIITALFFGNFFKEDDHFILSKGHAVPLIYALYTVLGIISEDELMKLRSFNSSLQGHPIPDNFLIEAATGSLGQGLSIGLGMTLFDIVKKKAKKNNVWVLLGDSEMAEGQVWEAIQLTSYYKLTNLIGIIDINRLGQRGETMLGWHIDQYEKRLNSFGWQTIIVNGHSFSDLFSAYNAVNKNERPLMILARTSKGKGVSFLENKDGWHGKPLKDEELKKALKELGKISKLKIKLSSIKKRKNPNPKSNLIINKNKISLNYQKGEMVATRKAYGNALVKLGKVSDKIVILDAETANSTYAELFKNIFPQRYFEMFIAEQNMVSTALGLSKKGIIPFVSSFAAFLTRAYDQIRMAQYSDPNIKIVGSHAGVSIGEDGPSQMGLEDLAMFRSVLKSVVLYPADAISTEKLVFEAFDHQGLVYLRTTRKETPVIYNQKDFFTIGGSRVHKINLTTPKTKWLIISAGITLFESLKAQRELIKNRVEATVIDCYSIKPLDEKTIKRLAKKVDKVLVVEDHYPAGGLGEAIKSLLSLEKKMIHHLAVRKIPKSGKPEELLDYEGISTKHIVKLVLTN